MARPQKPYKPLPAGKPPKPPKQLAAKRARTRKAMVGRIRR